MKSFLKKEKYPIFCLICVAALLFQCILIAFCNLVMGPKNIDCDSAMLYVHAIEMAKNRTYIIPDWSNITTLELDCSLFFAVPLYMLTENIYLSFFVANLMMVAILIGTLFMLFQGKSKIYALLCANFILIPYGIGQLDYFNMMFFNGSQYIVKVLIPLMLIALLVQMPEKKKPTWGYIILGVGYSALLLLSCISSGVYIPVVGIFPIFIGFLSYQLFCRKKLSGGFGVWGGYSTLLILVGLWINSRYGAGAKGNSMTLCSVYELQDNISACFWGIFELFGGVVYENVSVMSWEGIKVLLHMAYVVVLLVGAIVLLRKVLKKEASLLLTLFLTVFVWNTFILCVCKTQYGAATFEYRYHLIGMIPLLCAVVMLVLEWYEKEIKRWQMGISTVLMLVALVLNVTSYKTVFTHEYDISRYQQICDYATEMGLEMVYFFGNSTPSEICRLLDYKNESVTYLAVDGGGNILVYDYYNKYLEMYVQFENAILAIDVGYGELGDSLELYGHQYTKIQTIGDFNIYI